jgi:phage gp36-like protein
MAFIVDSDYSVQLRTEIGKVIDPTTQQTKLKRAVDMAISQVKNYLSGRYDLAKIFVDAPSEGETDERDSFVVMIVIDMALYHLWSKEGANNIPTTRADRYNDALEWLKAVQKGADTNLPLITDDNGGELVDMRIWSKHSPENNRF